MGERLHTYVAALVADWLGQRTGREHAVKRATDHDVYVSGDGTRSVAIAPALLWDADTAADDARSLMEERLSAGNVRGPHIVWVPPRAGVPSDEPTASDFVQRVQFAAASLQPGGRAEVELPVKVQLAKMREEGGYASVTGGLGRWWTLITERVNGTFHVNSQAMRRAPASAERREALFDHIGQMSRGLQTGQATEFETVEAWTVQKLRDEPLGETGFALAQAPPSIDPTDGTLMRRLVRKRLRDANDALAAAGADATGVALVGIFDYAESENIGAFVKSLDPALYAKLNFVCAVVDGDVRPILGPRGLE